MAHTRKVHFVPSTDLRQSLMYEYSPGNVPKDQLMCGQRYEYISENVRKSNLKCGNNVVPHEFVKRDLSRTNQQVHNRKFFLVGKIRMDLD